MIWIRSWVIVGVILWKSRRNLQESSSSRKKNQKWLWETHQPIPVQNRKLGVNVTAIGCMLLSRQLMEDIINCKMHAITLSPQPWILSKRPFTRVAHKLRPGWKHTFRSHHATGLEHGLRWRRHNLFWSWSVKIRVIRGCAGYSYSSWWCSGNLVQSKVTDRWVSDSELGKQGSRIRISRASCPSSTPLAASHCRFGTRRWGKWWLTV